MLSVFQIPEKKKFAVQVISRFHGDPEEGNILQIAGNFSGFENAVLTSSVDHDRNASVVEMQLKRDDTGQVVTVRLNIHGKHVSESNAD